MPTRESGRAGAPGVAGVPGVARALGQVAVAFRLVGALWLSTLGVVRYGVGEVTRPWVVAGTLVLVLAWTGVTVSVAARASEAGRMRLRGYGWLVPDVLVAAWTVVGPALLGEPVAFAGAYPFTTVVLVAWSRGRRTVLVVAAVLAVVAVWRTGILGLISLAQGVQDVLFYLAGALVLAWAVRTLEAAEAGRLAAEQALAMAREEQARSEERATTAAHLHDSVLQTLALVQRRAGEAGAVRALARRQERDLRAWLYGTGGETAATSLHAALQEVAGEIEAAYGLAVEVVVTGAADAVEVGERGAAAALVAATRETLVNVAKHAGVAEASVYLEVDDGRMAVYVRDRGTGFDPATVPADRHGLRDSVEERMRRHGGTAHIRSTPGAGTEVVLELPHPA